MAEPDNEPPVVNIYRLIVLLREVGAFRDLADSESNHESCAATFTG